MQKNCFAFLPFPFRQQIIEPCKPNYISPHLWMEKTSSDKMFNNLRDFYLYLSFLREFERRRMGSCQQQQLAQRTDGEHHHEHRRHESGSSENVIVESVAKNLEQYNWNRIYSPTVYLISWFSYSATFF